MKYYGKFRGIVKDIQDPLKRGRIRALVPEVSSSVVLDWALPCIPYGATINPNSDNQPNAAVGGFGMFWVPELDTGVWIEFESGDIQRPIWVGIYWSTPSKDGIPRHNVPSQALEETDPDTDELDYPKEVTLKTERIRNTATRRIVLELDQDTEDTDPWDNRNEYENPHIEIGRRGDTDEGGKNIVDIATKSRDLRIDTERNRDTESEKDIYDWAHQNVETYAGADNGLTQSTNSEIGNILENASNRINMIASGDPDVNEDDPYNKETLTGDSLYAKTRFSAGDIPDDDMGNAYDAAFNAADRTIKLTGDQFAKLESVLNDVIIRSRGNDVYVKTFRDMKVETGRNFHAVTTNGFLVETNSTGSVPQRATQLHYLNAGFPSDGTSPANESGKPSSFPQGSSKQFIRYIDERAIPSYNAHFHTVVIPEPTCDCCDDCGGTGGGIFGDIWLGQMSTYDYAGTDYDSQFSDGLLGQIQNIAGTLEPIYTTDSKALFGAIDTIASVVDGILGYLSSNFFSDVNEGLQSISNSSLTGSGGGLKSFDALADTVFNDYLKSTTHDLIQSIAKINGPNFKSDMAGGIPISIKIRGKAPGQTDLQYHPQNYEDIPMLGKYDSLLAKASSGMGADMVISNDKNIYGSGRYQGLISAPDIQLNDMTQTNQFSVNLGMGIYNPSLQSLVPPGSVSGFAGESGTYDPELLSSAPPGTMEVSTSTVASPELWQTERVDPSGTQESSVTPRKVSTEFTRGN